MIKPNLNYVTAILLYNNRPLNNTKLHAACIITHYYYSLSLVADFFMKTSLLKLKYNITVLPCDFFGQPSLELT